MLKRTLSHEDTIDFGKELVQEIERSGTKNIFLFGDLGSGKTTLVKGIGIALGIEEEIISPTFQIVRKYEKDERPLLTHIDLYRAESPEEILGIGWWDHLEEPVITAVEWAERAVGILPPDGIFVKIRFKAENERDIEIFISRENVFTDRNNDR